MSPDPETTVRALLALAGLTPPEEEVAAMVAAFPGSRALAESLHEMPGVRYAEPATVFHAEP